MAAKDTDLTLSYPGQQNLTGLTDKQFRDIFTGEVITAFDEHNIMKDWHRMRTITHGKSASFAVMGRANARYPVAGEAILGSNKIAANERVINVDDLLIADVAIYDLDDAKNHYDVRREYSKQLGVALAKRFDETTMRVAVLAARSSGIIDDEPGGSVIKGGATLATDGEQLAEAVFTCSQTFDEKDVPEQERCLVLRPAQYYLLNQTTKVLNRDWLGAGSYSDGKLDKIAGIKILMSNHLPKTNIEAAVTGEKNTYYGDFTKTLGLCMQSNAIATVKLRDLVVQQSGADFNIVYQATLMVAKYAMGHGILNPSYAIELSTDTATTSGKQGEDS